MSYPIEADMYPDEWIPTRSQSEYEAELFAEWYWREHDEEDNE